MKCPGIALLTALLAISAPAAEKPSTISLDGRWKVLAGNLAPANAYEPQLDDSDWGTLQVPGNWHLQGRDLSGVVWYRRHFVVPQPRDGQPVKLSFEGVDYSADVWINGSYAGFHEGYFEPFAFYVHPWLKNGDNVIVVRVNSPDETPEAWSLHKRLIKGVLSHHDTRPGGAWSTRGQEQNTGGIWGEVTLSFPDPVDIARVHVTTRPESGGSWVAEVETRFASNGPTAPLRVEVQLTPANFTPTEPQQAPAVLTLSGIEPDQPARVAVHVDNPRLWWTWDQGEPNLYRATVRVFDDDRLVGESSVSFGFRTIEVDPATRQWRLNGRPLFIRGTNYISSQWLSETTEATLGFDLGLMKNANINAIRVHAHLERDAFYSQCDARGLLVWQDFPLQWGYDESMEFVEEASRQARGMVDWLYNHPSIAVWTMQNEPPFDADWMKWKYRDYRPDQNKALNAELARVVSEADQTRWVHSYSTTGEHQWLGWYSGSWKDFAKPSKEAIVSEYGAQALPSLSSLRKIFSETELWPKTDSDWDVWEYHNFQRHETFDLASVKQGSNINDWIENTQHYQAKLTQFAAENYRRQKYSPVTAIFQFLFNEDWPSVNWGIVDYWRNPKPGYEALRTAYQPVLPSIEWSRDTWNYDETATFGLWVVNDRATGYPGASLTWTLRDVQRVYKETSLPIDISPDSSAKITRLSLPDLACGSYTLVVALRDAAGALLGINSLAFDIEPETGRETN